MKTPLRNTLRLAALGLLGALSIQTTLAQRPLGVDVYHGSGVINWSSVKSAGKSFAWAKATEATYGQDTQFINNANNGKAAGVLIGAYHFARPDLTSPGPESSYFWSFANPYIKPDGKTLMPMLDLETFNGHLGASSYGDWADQFCNAIVSDASAAGIAVKPVMYTTTCEACNFDGTVSQWTPWIAALNGENGVSGNPWDGTSCGSCEWWGSATWTVWQYSWTGSVPGIPGVNGSVDLDSFNGTSSTLTSQLVIGSGHPNPAAIVLTNGDMQLFAIDLNTAIYANTQNSPDGTWNGFGSTQLGGTQIQQVTALVTHNGHQEVFALGGDNVVYNNYYNGSSWSGWSGIGSQKLSTLCAILNTNGTEEIFGLGLTGDVWTITQTSPNANWGSSSWVGLGGGGNTRIAAVVGHNGQQEVFVAGNGKNVQNKYWQAANGAWSGWGNIGSDANELCAIVNTNGIEELFTIDTAGVAWTVSQTAPSSGWGSWVNLGGAHNTRIAALTGHNGVQEVFVIGTGNSVYNRWWQPASQTWSTGWNNLGGVQLSLTVKMNADGREMIFGLGTDSNHSIWYLEQTAPNSTWGGWTSMGGSFE